MKKVLVVVGSARQGNSLFAANQIERIISKNGKVNCEMLQLSKNKIEYCDGCLHCDTTGICHKKDDMASILEKLKRADGVVFISPTRWSLLSGDLKVFIDRLNPTAGKGFYSNKKSFLIAVGQTNCNDSVSIARALESLKFFSDDAGFTLADSHVFENCLNQTDLSTKAATLKLFEEKIIKYIINL